MKYALDTEFIDTPSCSALISLALVGEDGGELYFEFDHPVSELTPWLNENVVPHLSGQKTSHQDAAELIKRRIGNQRPEFWCYYGAYDWYWFCRLFGGFMKMPENWPMLANELAMFRTNIPNVSGAEHNALNDAKSIMVAVKQMKAWNSAA